MILHKNQTTLSKHSIIKLMTKFIRYVFFIEILILLGSCTNDEMVLMPEIVEEESNVDNRLEYGFSIDSTIINLESDCNYRIQTLKRLGGFLEPRSDFRIDSFSYDSEGKEIEMRNVHFSEQYVYNSEGYLDSILYYFNQTLRNVSKITLNEDNLMIKLEEYKNGELSETYHFNYDPFGKVIELKTEMNNRTVHYGWREGNVVSMRVFYGNRLSQLTSFVYDDKPAFQRNNIHFYISSPVNTSLNNVIKVSHKDATCKACTFSYSYSPECNYPYRVFQFDGSPMIDTITYCMF